MENYGYNESFMYDESYEDQFKEMSRFLKMAGVKNNMFMLKLYDEDLERYKVDPFNVDKEDIELQEKIKKEAIRNIWYFLRFCVRRPDQSGAPAPFILNPVTMAEAYCFENKINLYIVSYRQQFRTNGALICNIWNRRPLSFAYPVAKYMNSRSYIARQKEIRELLPYYLKDTFKNIQSSDILASTRYYNDIECSESIGWEQKLHDDIKTIVTGDRSNNHLIIESSASGLGGNSIVLSGLRDRYKVDPLKFYDEKEKRKMAYIELDADRCGVSYTAQKMMRNLMRIPEDMKKEDMKSWQLAELYLIRK